MRTRAKKTEIEKRDEVLDALKVTRASLIAIAKATAWNIAKMTGNVTSSDVLRVMRASNIDGLSDVDARFMGAVFRYGWKRKGYRSQGSHGRPVSVWVRR